MLTYTRRKRSRRLRKISEWLAYQWRVTRRSVITIEDVRIRVGRHMSRRVEQALSKGSHEREELQILGRILSPGDVVLEIGAGLGLVSAFCAKCIGSDRVFACEADPDLEPCIWETYRLNGVEPSLEICAVGPAPGRVMLYRDEHFISSSVVRRRAGLHPVEVSGKALNYLVQKVRPTVLVVNAEGASPELFDGADLPTVSHVVLELHDHTIGPEGTDRVRSQLSACGFRMDRALSSAEHLVFWAPGGGCSE
jgi:FkbM family methyltransferase